MPWLSHDKHRFEHSTQQKVRILHGLCLLPQLHFTLRMLSAPLPNHVHVMQVCIVSDVIVMTLCSFAVPCIMCSCTAVAQTCAIHQAVAQTCAVHHAVALTCVQAHTTPAQSRNYGSFMSEVLTALAEIIERNGADFAYPTELHLTKPHRNGGLEAA